MPIGFAPLLLIYCSPFASVYGNAMVPIVFLYRTHTKEKPCTLCMVYYMVEGIGVTLSPPPCGRGECRL